MNLSQIRFSRDPLHTQKPDKNLYKEIYNYGHGKTCNYGHTKTHAPNYRHRNKHRITGKDIHRIVDAEIYTVMKLYKNMHKHI